MNWIQKFGASLFNIGPRGASTSYPLDPDLIDRDKLVNVMAKKLQSQDAQLSKIYADQNLKQQQLNQEDFDREQIQELNRQEKESKKDKFEGTIFLRDAYKNILFKNKLYNKIQLTDRDGKKSFGRFGDFVLIPNIGFGITERDSNNIISYGPTLDHIIYKPESIGNQLMLGQIRLPIDENFQHLPDIEKVKVPECMRDDETGEIVWAKVAEKPLLEMVQEKEDTISEQQLYIEKIEYDKVDLVSKNRDLSRALGIEQNTSETSQTELSKAMDKSFQFEQKIGGLQMRVIQMQAMKVINDKLIETLEKVKGELLEKLELEGSSTALRKAKDEVQQMITWAKDKIGKTVIVKEETEKEEVKKVGSRV